MTIKLTADGADDLVFEVKGKIRLALTRKGLIYRGKMVEDEGKVHDLMMKFLGLAEADIQQQMHEQIVTHVPDEQARLAQLAETKTATLIIQRSTDGEDDGHWENLFPADVPYWVMEPDVIADMMDGTKVKSEDGGFWYRTIHVIEPEEQVH